MHIFYKCKSDSDCFNILFMWLTSHHLIQRICGHQVQRMLWEFRLLFPHLEKVLAHIQGIGQSSQQAGFLQLLEWACWGKISLSARENHLPHHLPVGEKVSGKKGMKNVEDLFWAAPLDQHRVPGVITYSAETKKMGTEESKASPVLLNNV